MNSEQNIGGSAAAIFREVPPLEFRGKKYYAGPITIKVMRLFEAWLWKRDLQVLQACQKELGYLDYQAQVESWRKGCALGEWAWNSIASRLARESEEGAKYLAFLRLSEGAEIQAKRDKANHPAMVTEELVEAILADSEKRGELATLMEMAADPNPSRPSPEEPADGQ